MLDTPVNVGDERPSLSELATRLVHRAVEYAQAQVALYRIDATRRAVSGGWAAGYLLFAWTLAQGALVALLVGLVMLVGQAVGLGLGLAIVIGATFLLAALLGWLGMRKIRAMIDPDGAS